MVAMRIYSDMVAMDQSGVEEGGLRELARLSFEAADIFMERFLELQEQEKMAHADAWNKALRP